MHEAYTFCFDTALQFARRLLPETRREDCAADFRLHMRLKAGSDARLMHWCTKNPAYIVHCARHYIVDCARRLGRHPETSLSDDVNSPGEPVNWDLPDNRIHLDDGLNREAFW